MNDELREFVSTFAGHGVVRRIFYFPSLESTNDTARDVIRSGQAAGSLILADQQTKGRGRAGRSWISPPDSGLWMSLILRPAMPPDRFFVLNLACSLAVARALKHTTPDIELKWPNDVLARGRKTAGILLETCQADNNWYVIAGIGVNVNQETFPHELESTATSLRILTGKHHNILQILVLTIEVLNQTLQLPDRTIIAEWKAASRMWNKEAVIRQNDAEYTATVLDLAEDGGLLISREGKKQIVYAADVSLRL